MNTTVSHYDVKEVIERMKGLNPSSYISIGYAAIDTYTLSTYLSKLREPKIEWVLLDYFNQRPSLVLLPLFFDDFSKETKINIWKNRERINLYTNDLVNFLKSIHQEQVYRATQETKLEYSTGIIEYMFKVFMEDRTYTGMDNVAIEDDIKELFIYYLKANKIYIYDLETTILNSILYTKCTLTGLMNLRNIVDSKVKNLDITINLLFIAVTYIHMYSILTKLSSNENRNNYLLRYIFSYKNIERMMKNEWININ